MSPARKSSVEKARPRFFPLEQIEKGPVLAANAWRNNAEMMADVCKLHVRKNAVVVDVTYGKGNFWTVHRPEGLIAHDLDKLKGDGVDWRNLPEADRSVDVVVMDPEYVARGGRATSTIPEMVSAFGMDYAPKSPEALWTDIETGIEEATRVLKHKGLFMLKMMPYVSSQHLMPVFLWVFAAFAANRLELHDWFTFVGKPGPQPKMDKCRACIDGTEASYDPVTHVTSTVECSSCKGLRGKVRPQQHARNNASHLLVGRLIVPKAER